MRTTPSFRVRVLSAGTALLAAAAASFAAPLPAAAATATPSGLKAVERAQTAVELDWASVSGAPRYRVAIATRSDMSNATYHRFTPSAAEISGLRANTTYYVKVRVITAGGGNLSPYSRAVTVTTRSSSGYRYLSPNDLAATPGSSTAQLSWTARAADVRYRVQYATSADMANPTYRRFSPASASLANLRSSSRYWFKVRVIDGEGRNLSAYSPAVSAATEAAPPTVSSAPLRVASYNIRCSNCFDNLPDELPWSERRSAVVATIKGAAPDVVGLQEAGQGWLKDADGTKINLSQFEDLQQRLGSPWALTNSKRNNCVKDTTPTNCVYADQGASQGTKILYNSDRVEMLDSGSTMLPSIDADSNARYVAWAVLEQRSTGKRFFFANTHLEHRDDTSGSTRYHDLRRSQAQAALASINENNPDKLPVVMASDLNSTRFASPTNAPYDVFIGAGLVDPLGGAYRTTKTAPGATVEDRINTWLSSFNGFRRQAPGYPTWINGSYLDYILTTPMRVSEWETVADLDADGRFVGVIPSDHNMVRATVYLP